MSKTKNAATQFHFNKLNDDQINEWAKTLVLNKVGILIWSKGNEENPQKYFTKKYEPKKKIVWLSIKTSVFKSGISDLVDTDIFLKAEWERVYLFGQTKLLYDEKEKSHYLILEGEFFKSQQRTNLRVEAVPKLGITFKVLIGDKEYEAFDLSFGGTSFFTDEEFEEGQQVDKIKVVAENETFFIPRTKVVKILEVNDEDREGQKRIALNFVKIPHDTEVGITKKVESLKKKIDKSKG